LAKQQSVDVTSGTKATWSPYLALCFLTQTRLHSTGYYEITLKTKRIINRVEICRNYFLKQTVASGRICFVSRVQLLAFYVSIGSDCITVASHCYVVRMLVFRGHAVAYLVQALCHKPEGRGLDSRCHRIFN
jgi:hypothetical protein